MRIRVLLATMLCLAIGLTFAAPAAFAQYPPPGGVAGVNDSSVGPGDDVTVFGSGWQGSVNLDFLSAPVDLGIANVNAQGAFSKTVTIPADASPGAHDIRVSGTASNGQSDTVFIPVQVLGAGAGAGGAGSGGAGSGGAGASPLTIPFTGIVITRWMALVGVLLLLGAVALTAGRVQGRVRSRAH